MLFGCESFVPVNVNNNKIECRHQRRCISVTSRNFRLLLICGNGVPNVSSSSEANSRDSCRSGFDRINSLQKIILRSTKRKMEIDETDHYVRFSRLIDLIISYTWSGYNL